MKGQISDLALGIVTAIVVLFIGLFAINTFANISISDFKTFTYTYDTNSTNQTFNKTNIKAVNFTTTTFSTIEGSSPISNLTLFIHNINTTLTTTVNVSLNGVEIGTFSSTNGTTVEQTFVDVNPVQNAVNNVTVGSDSSGSAPNDIVNITLSWPSGTTNTASGLGTTFDKLIISVGTIFDVIVLTIIVVALGVAIAVLRGFGGAPQMTGGVVTV